MIRAALFVVLLLVFALLAAGLVLPPRESLGLEFLYLSQGMLVASLAIFFTGKSIQGERLAPFLVGAAVAVALAVRLMLLIGPGESYPLSSDVFRYVWDGKMLVNGVNPFLFAPSAPELQHFREYPLSLNINHPNLPTIYPPVAQYIFGLSYLIGGGTVWGFRIVSVAVELLSILLLDRWLSESGAPRSHLLLWLFSPLILIEFIFSSHVDLLAIPFLLAMLLLLGRKHVVAAAAMFTAAVLVKFLCLLFLPFVLQSIGGSGRWRFLGMCAATGVLLYLPFVGDAGWHAFGSLPTYLAEWEYNGSVYLLMKNLFDSTTSRLICAVLLLGVGLLILLRRSELEKKLMAIYTAFAVLTTTLFPWYLAPVMPFAVRFGWLPMLVFSGMVLLSYHGHDQIALIAWQKIEGMEFLIYGPFLILLLAGWVRGRAMRSTAAAA